MYTYIYICTYRCTYVYIYMYRHVYVYIYIAADQIGVWAFKFDSIRFVKRSEAKREGSEKRNQVKAK